MDYGRLFLQNFLERKLDLIHKLKKLIDNI